MPSVLLLLIIFSISGRASVLLNDPNNICSETEGSHVLPGVAVTLICVVNNTGASLNLLVWITPVSHNRDLSHTSGARYQKNSIFSSTATFNGDLANSTLTFTTTQSLDNRVVICRDNIAHSKTCSLLIYTIPCAPINLTNISITYQSASVSWSTPNDTGGCNIENYIITVTPLYGGDPWNITTTDNSTTYTVTGLMSGQRYNFVIRGNNCLGLGRESKSINITLPDAAILSTPLNLTIVAVTYQSVNLSWIIPIDTGGCNIVNYIITVTQLDGSDPRNITTTDNSTSYTVTALMYGQSYNFTVRARNYLGMGEESNAVTVLIPGEVPKSIQHVSICSIVKNGKYLLNIFWNCSKTPDANTPPVTNYTINIGFSTHNFPGNCPSRDFPHSIQTFNNSENSISITANNIVGSSTSSNIIINNIFSIMSSSELTGEMFILLRIRITWNSPCIDRVQVIISYYKSSGSYVPQNSSSSYSMNEDISGKLFLLENLDPDSEYIYNVLLYDGKELIFSNVNKTFNTNNRGTEFITNSSLLTDKSWCTAVVIVMSVSVILTFILFSCLITYYCCAKSKSSYSIACLEEVPVSTSSLVVFHHLKQRHDLIIDAIL